MVDGTLMVKLVPGTKLAMVAPAGTLVPEIGMPTIQPAVEPVKGTTAPGADWAALVAKDSVLRLMRPPPVMVRSPAPLMTPVWVRSEPPVRRVDGPLTVMPLARARWTVLDRSRVAPPPRVMAPVP